MTTSKPSPIERRLADSKRARAGVQGTKGEGQGACLSQVTLVCSAPRKPNSPNRVTSTVTKLVWSERPGPSRPTSKCYALPVAAPAYVPQLGKDNFNLELQRLKNLDSREYPRQDWHPLVLARWAALGIVGFHQDRHSPGLEVVDSGPCYHEYMEHLESYERIRAAAQVSFTASASQALEQLRKGLEPPALEALQELFAVSLGPAELPGQDSDT